MKERDLSRLVEDWLDVHHIWKMRVQSGKVKSQFGGWVKLADAGTADYVTMVRASKTTQIVRWLELKRPGKGKQSPAQKVFLEQVESLGHFYFIIRGVPDLEAAFK